MFDNPAVQIPRIRCAICNTTVDAIEWWDDRAQSTRFIRVHCHGANETMAITLADFMRLGQRGMDAMAETEGLAFATQMLNQGVTPTTIELLSSP